MVNCKSTVALLCIFALYASGQTPATMPSRLPQTEGPGVRMISPYRTGSVSAASFVNSPRTYQLIRAGNMYLSLQDAIALTLENNLDLQLQRYNPLIAGTELKRTKGGGLPRGLTYTIRELPQGVGGPGGPLLTTLGSSNTIGQLNANTADLAVINQQQTNLSVQSTIPYSQGSPVPAYDPLFNLGVNGSHLSQPQNSYSSQGTTNLVQTQATGSGEYLQGFSTGTALAVNYDATRFDANWLRSDYNPYTMGSLGVSISQPLLQGFGIDVNRRFIRIAGNEQQIANLIVNQQLIATISAVIRLYWDLVSLRADVTVKEQALATAQRLYQDNKQQVDVGTLAPLQLKQAAAEVARAKQDLIISQSLVDQQEIVLKNVITRSGAEDASLENVHIIPLDRIEVPEHENTPPVNDLIGEALKNRPDLAQGQLQVANADLSLKGSRNQLLPRLDIIASATNNALAGAPNSRPPVPNTVRNFDPFFIGGSGTLLSQMFQRNFPDYGVGLQLSIPLRNRVAQADVARDQLQLRQSQVAFKQAQNQVRVEVENALLALRRARASYDAAVETQQLQQEALDAEQQRLSVGQSTSFFVIQYERDLAQARSTVVIAEGAYAKAKAALDRAVGRTLTANNISFSEGLTGVVARPHTPLPAVTPAANLGQPGR